MGMPMRIIRFYRLLKEMFKLKTGHLYFGLTLGSSRFFISFLITYTYDYILNYNKFQQF